jgi:hypothetical protein
MPARTPRCGECGSALARDQRYCLVCGARAGDRDPRLLPLMSRARESWRPPAAPGPGPHGPRFDAATGASLHSRARRLRAPGGRGALRTLAPRAGLSLGLVGAFLGFGVLLGAAAASAPLRAESARSQTPLRLVVPAPARAAGGSADPSTAGESPAAAEPAPEPGGGETTTAPGSPGTSSHEPSSSGSSGSSGAGSGSSGAGSGSGSASASAPATKLPKIKHVFLIVLSDESYAQAFGPASKSEYLSSTLEHRGELLAHYDAVAHEELANEIALLSGQGPTLETAANCSDYAAIAPGTVGAFGQVQGNGCVYPRATPTLLSELEAKHLAWRAYLEGSDEAGASAPACPHPQPGQADPTAQQAASTGPFATFRDPFAYFAAIAGAPDCARHVVGMGSLAGDLRSTSSTPSFSYLAPDRCHDGNPTPCTAGAAAGMSAADSFLQRVVPEITSSRAYRESGLLVITTDEAPSSGEYEDSSSCCGQPAFANLPPVPGALTPRGGGSVGALLLSPYVPAGATSQEPANHFSLLRTIEQVFSLKPIGYAALPAVKPLEPGLFTAGRAG